MTRVAEPTPHPAQAAAEWVVRRDRGLSAAEASAFAAWRAAHPDHAAEFARIDRSWRSLDRLAPAPVLSAAADAIVHRAQARQSRRHRLSLFAGGLLATAAALAFAYVGWYRPAPLAADNFQIIASTSREILLPDGSRATLNGASRIETDYTPGERRIRLVQGEAHFTVAKDSARPFFVSAGPITVRAVGTAFNVRLDASAVEVLVTEGRVRVNDNLKGVSLLPPTLIADSSNGPGVDEGVLAAGQRVTVNLAAVVDASAQARVAAVAPAEIEQSLAWQSTRLVFNDTPLDEVVGAFNRYNERQLILGEQALAQRRITGVFRADNLAGFTRLLEAGVAVRAEPRSHRETVLRAGY